jgi:protein SCO1/2
MRAVWLIVAAAALVAVACSGGDSLRGTVLKPSRQAPDFELTNQNGEPVQLSSRLDSVVALTFLYTNCPDICPVITSHLRQAHRLLGEDATEIEILAVSVDPDRDSVEAAHEFSERWQMLANWDYLVGTEARLKPVWEAYYVAPIADLRGADEAGDSSHSQTSGTDKLARDISATYTVAHSGPVYLIDRTGMMRSLFTLPFEPEDVVHDLRVLMAEDG